MLGPQNVQIRAAGEVCPVERNAVLARRLYAVYQRAHLAAQHIVDRERDVLPRFQRKFNRRGRIERVRIVLAQRESGRDFFAEGLSRRGFGDAGARAGQDACVGDKGPVRRPVHVAEGPDIVGGHEPVVEGVVVGSRARGASVRRSGVQSAVVRAADAPQHGIDDAVALRRRLQVCKFPVASGDIVLAKRSEDVIGQHNVACFEPRAAVFSRIQVFDIHGAPVEVVEDRVVVLASRIVPHFKRVVVLVVRRIGAGANVGCVGDDGYGVGFSVFGLRSSVVLSGAIADVCGLYDEPELSLAAESFVVVHGVVSVECGDKVAGVGRAAEPFEAVVLVVEDFDVLNGGAGADAAHGESVDFVSRADVRPAVANGDIAEDAGVVLVVASDLRARACRIATVESASFGDGYAFDSRFARRGVQAGFAQDDNASP